MNIVKLQNQLKSVPVETLIQYVQGANPEVPSYLALAEIKNRKDMEARYASQNEKAPSSSVAEDLTQTSQSGLQTLAGNAAPNQVAQGAPTMSGDQGVAGLDTGDMYNEQNFAGGGIVAFSGQDGISDVTSKRYQAWGEDAVGPGYLWAGLKDLAGMPFQYAWTTDPVTGKLVRRRDVEGMTPSLDAYNKAAQLRKQGLLAEADTLEKAAASPKVNRVGLAGLDTSAGAEPGMTFSRDELANITQSRTFPTAKTEAPPARATQATADQEGLSSLYAPIKDRSAEIDQLIRPTEGMAEEKMAKYQKMVGDLPNKDKLEALVQKYETGAAEQERTAPWMALAKAGFSMAGGKSPYAIQNIAEGAQTGLADYVQAKDRLEKLRDKQIDVQYKLDNAAYERKKAAADYGIKSQEHQEAKNDEAKLKKIDYQTNLDLKNQANKIAAYEAVSKDKYHEAYLQAFGVKDKNALSDKVLYEKWAETGGETVNGPFDQYRIGVLKNVLPLPRSTEEYNKLKSGEAYLDPQGNRRVKQ